MPEPITTALIVGGAAQAVSGIMQYYQAEKARKASDKRLKEIEAMFNAIVPPEYDLKIYDDPKLAQNIPAPALNLDRIDPQLYRSVGQFIPEVAQYVQEANPQLVQATAAANQGRQSQMDALEKYRQIAAGGVDPEFEQKMSDASQRARRDAQSRQASILQDANRRGQLGSGIMLASQMNQGADAMQRQAIESQLAAAESYRNQLGAMGQGAQLGGQIRASEMSEQGRNADIVNSFNERTSRAYQSYLQQIADEANRAKYSGWQNDQAIANRNVDAQNAANQEQVQRYNQGQKTYYDVAQNNRNNTLDLEDRKNRLRQQMYDNLIAKTSGRAGISQQINSTNMQNAQDRNQITRGLGDAVTSGALYYGKYGKAQQDTQVPPYNEPPGTKWTGKDYPYDASELYG